MPRKSEADKGERLGTAGDKPYDTAIKVNIRPFAQLNLAQPRSGQNRFSLFRADELAAKASTPFQTGFGTLSQQSKSRCFNDIGDFQNRPVDGDRWLRR